MKPSLMVRALLWIAGLCVWVGRGINVGGFNLQGGDVALGLVIAYGLAVSAVKPSVALRLSPRVGLVLGGLAASILLVLLAAVVSLFNAADDMAVVRFLGRWLLALLAVPSLFYLLRTEDRTRLLERSLLFGALASVAISAAGYFIPSIGELTLRYQDRSQALLNHPNQFAILLVALVPLTMSIAMRKPGRTFPWFTLVVLVGGLALTGSKFNLLALCVTLPLCALMCLAIVPGAQPKTVLAFGLAVGVLALGGVATVAVQRFNPRTLGTILGLLTDPIEVSAVEARSKVWAEAFQLGLDHPFTGVGAGQTGLYLSHDHAHNAFLEFFAALGIWGLLALLCFLVVLSCLVGAALLMAFGRSRLTVADRLGLIGCSLGVFQFMVSNQSSDSFGGTTLPLLWLLVGMCLGRWQTAARGLLAPRPDLAQFARVTG